MGAAALQRQENCEEPNYQRTRMQKDVVIQELKKRGCRITKQRRMLLEVILENECSCCKEIYYNASRLDPGIGSATVYRMVNLLEEIGAISRRNMFKITGIYEHPLDFLFVNVSTGLQSCQDYIVKTVF